MSTIFAPNSPAVSEFSCKKFKQHLDTNGHLNRSFDLYFKGKKAATYTLDPWSQESHVDFVSEEIKASMIAYAHENKLFDEVKAIYIKDILSGCSASEREAHLANTTFTFSDIIIELSQLFATIDEDKKFQAKLNRLFKKAIVVGNSESYIPLSFKITLTELLKYQNGRKLLEETIQRAQQIIKEHEKEGYAILNPKSQLESLGLA